MNLSGRPMIFCVIIISPRLIVRPSKFEFLATSTKKVIQNFADTEQKKSKYIKV